VIDEKSILLRANTNSKRENDHKYFT